MPDTEIVTAPDGFPAEVVGVWVREKHDYLCRYLDASRGARRKFLGPGRAGATFADLFCAYGRSNIRDTADFVDGSAVAAWKASQNGPAPFSAIYVGDLMPECRSVCMERLRAAGAPAHELSGPAIEAAHELVRGVHPGGLHLVFLDPYNLGQLDFRIIETLSTLDSVDMLIHVSAMDLQRRLPGQVALSDEEASEFDSFAPGWRKVIDRHRPQHTVRAELLAYWERGVQKLGMRPFSDRRLISMPGGPRLYWLMLASRHPLAHELWRKIGRSDRQTDMGF